MEVWMNRFAMGFLLVLMGTLAGGAGSVSAQTPDASTQTPDASAATESHPFYAELVGAGTFGHVSSGSVGLEAGYRVAQAWQVFVEGGRMSNVATANLDQRAQVIATDLASSFSTSQRAVYFDVGTRYRPPVTFGKLHPYGLLGLGFASVKTSTTFGPSGNGQIVSLGNDLSSTLTKLYLTAGVGVTVSLGSRYLIDISYRYGHVYPKDSEINDDTAIGIQRLQAGFGVRF
jgi:opacity protein-like surface antigen